MKQPHGTTSVMISTTLLSCFFKFIAVLLHPRWCDATCFQCDRARRPTDRTRSIHLFLYFFSVTGRQISTMKCWSKGTVFVLLLSWRRVGVGGGEEEERGWKEKKAAWRRRWRDYRCAEVPSDWDHRPPTCFWFTILHVLHCGVPFMRCLDVLK